MAGLAADGPTECGVGGEVDLGDADLSHLVMVIRIYTVYDIRIMRP